MRWIKLFISSIGASEFCNLKHDEKETKFVKKKKTRTRKHLIVFLAYEYHDPPDAQKWLVHWGRSASSSPRKEVVRDPALSVCWRPPGQSSGPDCRQIDCSELPTRFLLKKWNESK